MSGAPSPSFVSMRTPAINLLAVFFRHRWAMIAAFLAVVGLGITYLATTTPKYESTAQLIIRFGDKSLPDIAQAPPTELTPADRREIVLSNSAILQSPDLIQSVVQTMGIEQLYPDIIENPPSGWTSMNEATRRFAAGLWVGVGLQNNVITISFLHADGSVAREALMQLLKLYGARQTEVYRGTYREFLKTEMDEAARRLEMAQSALGAFKEKYKISDHSQEISELLRRRGEISSNLSAAQAAYDQARERRDELAKLMKTVPANQPGAAGGELYRALDEAQTRLAELTTKRTQMLATYAANSPALATLEAAIGAVEAEVAVRRNEVAQRSSINVNTVHQAVQTDYLRTVADAQSNREPVRVLAGQLSDVNQRLDVVEQIRGPLMELVREERLAEETYRSLFTRYEDARIKDSLNEQSISTTSVISQPSLPYRPARPRRAITLLAFMFAGTLFAVGSALALQVWRNDFMTPGQVAVFLGLPVLATIPARGPARPRFLLLPRGSQ